MNLAFVCGPYRADTHYGVYLHIQKAIEVSVWLRQQGFAVICPHKNSEFMSGVVDEDQFLAEYIEIVSRCDIVVYFGLSTGAVAEIEAAIANGLAIYRYENIGSFRGIVSKGYDEMIAEINRWRKAGAENV